MSLPHSTHSSYLYLNVAQSLENVGDADALQDMLQMLHNMLASDVQQIGQCMDASDFSGAGQLLHALKGCIPIFCYPTLCQELTAVEQMSKSASPEGCAPAYVPLRTKLDSLRTEIGMYLAQTGG